MAFGRGAVPAARNAARDTQKRVSERFTRQGDEILYEVTVEDPEVLVEPWVMTPRILRINTNPDAGLLPERGHCEVSYEEGAIETQIRH